MFHRQYGLGWFHIDLDTVTGNGLLENSIGSVIFPKRTDNLVCAAVVLEDQLVVKTVMHHFDWEAMP